MNTKTKFVLRKELDYLSDAVETFENEKRTAKAEALRKATLQVATMRADLAKMIWEAVNVSEASIADISAVSGYSRATIYRFLDEHVENTGGNPNALSDAVEEAQLQKRFSYQGVGDSGEILVLDTISNTHSSIYIEAWKNDWYYQEYGRYGTEAWREHPELDVLVSNIENGLFVPSADLTKLDEKIVLRISGAKENLKNAATLLDNTSKKTKVEDVPTFDAWE